MGWDNRIFNVNGRGEKTLEATLTLAFDERGPAVGYRINRDKGLILVWALESKEDTPFPTRMTAKQVTPIVWAWLESKPDTKLENWDADTDHDGDNSLGWRVYCEDWGHVETHYAIVAVKPACLWHGK